MKIGFIGLGAMGKPMARNLLKTGCFVAVTDVNPEAVAELVAAGAHTGINARAVAEITDAVVLMLPNGSVVEKVVAGEEGVLAGARPGFCIIDMSSVAPVTTRKMAALAAERGVEYIDAPVSGGVKGATEGTLTIMAGGRPEVVEQYRPVLQTLGQKIQHVGACGAGDAVKLVNNLLLAANMAAAAEAFTLGVKLGLSPQILYDVISESSGGSYAVKAKMPNFVLKGNFAPGFTIDLQYKDLELAVQSGKDAGMPLLLANVVQQVYEQARAAGLGQEDISAVIKLQESVNKVSVRTNKA
ncbi:MAG TPA: NAD(P)-binding domain-containing protein [Patescibacteria group bacterium]|nr:NAD(P)-binding domain-containing protein [Patescibacteria group bacterium]